MSPKSLLLRAVRNGTLLAGLAAGCGEAEPDPSTPAGLEPLPAGVELGCFGPDYGTDPMSGYQGQCCREVVCRPPENGACPPGDDGRFYGSGSCLCGDEPQIDGPYAIAEDDPEHAEARRGGECCYATASIGCTGRPLVVASSPRLAPLVGRGDWC